MRASLPRAWRQSQWSARFFDFAHVLVGKPVPGDALPCGGPPSPVEARHVGAEAPRGEFPLDQLAARLAEFAAKLRIPGKVIDRCSERLDILERDQKTVDVAPH